MAETLQLWNEILANKFIVVISDVVIEEIEQCSYDKKLTLYGYLKDINLLRVEETEEVIMLTNKYLELGVLKERCRDDCRHIAIATVYECDFIVSWNFKHFVNVKTTDKVQVVNKLLGYNEIKIIPPPMLVEGE